ncbi:Glutamate receptor 1 [Papilio machaon]|uniref:Glutamate receptor 1 n=1 Tax=Papilio machaon TaxID=76193 RepID=A0A194QZX2_PAPMA|nr:Glutamate receptor 1 [Papilio machaon]
MLGAVMADSFDTLHSYTNTFQLPFITPWFPEKVIPPSSGLKDYAVSMRPDYHQAVIDTITYYGWKNVIFIYDSHDALTARRVMTAPYLQHETSSQSRHAEPIEPSTNEL